MSIEETRADIEQIKRVDAAARNDPPLDMVGRLRLRFAKTEDALWKDAADELERTDKVLTAAATQCRRDQELIAQRREEWLDLKSSSERLTEILRYERKTAKKKIEALTKRVELAEKRRDILIDQLGRKQRRKATRR
jgi:hypothetical protein